MNRFIAVLMLVAIIPTAVPASEPPQSSELEQRKAGARDVVTQLADQLSSELKAAMKEGGPKAAIRVCRDRAPAIKSRLSRETGWQITRVGTRVRNPLLGMPDAHEAEILSRFQSELDDGAAMPKLEHASVEKAGDDRYFRYMKAIGVKPQCLGCHGPVENQPKAIRTTLEEQYPADKAVGYEAGELRGAFSVIQNMADAYETP
ncbi:DUF3365 domain-containing protein [Salicola sp. Rm-C-2C1-2]|uniref:Tll0287-like domain-containing protein n=1 Tax=Salicola sp. Rm-C-2C1-2 TaxID=3141321 RepID=UPI0032E44741